MKRTIGVLFTSVTLMVSAHSELLSQMDLGEDIGRAWADFDADGNPDFCRVLKGGAPQQLAVTLSTGPLQSERAAGATIISAPLDAGYAEGRAWADHNGDGRIDYCRVVGLPGNVRLAVTLSNGSAFGGEVYSGIIDWGYPEGRAWADFSGDGKADYLRVVGTQTDQHVKVTISTGNGFASTEILSPPLDWGYPESRQWRDVDADGKVDFVRVVGNDRNIIATTFSTGTGFGRTLLDPQIK